MKLTCDASALQGALALVKPAVSSRPKVPILANVWLSAAGDQMQLAATDLGLGITCWLPAQVEREGAITVPYARLDSWMSGLAAPARSRPRRTAVSTLVALEVAPGSQSVAMRCARREATIPGQSADDFPRVPTFAGVERVGEPPIEFDLPLFCTMVEQVLVASDPRIASEPYGRLGMEVVSGKVRLGARNEGMRAQCEGAMPGALNGHLMLALAARDAAKLARVLRGTGQRSLQVVVDGEWPRILFHMPGLDLVTSLFEPGSAVFERQGYGVDGGSRVVIEREALAAALAFVAFVARHNGHVIDLRVLPEGGALLVEARDEELGEQATEVEVTGSAGAEEFRCQPTFGLLDQLVTGAGGTTIELAWYGESGTLVLRSPIDAPSCLTTYILLSSRGDKQGGRP